MEQIKDLVLNITIIYPVLITVASFFFTLISLDLSGLLFTLGAILFGFISNIYLKRFANWVAPNFKPFLRPHIPKSGCGMFPDFSGDPSTLYAFGMPSGHAQISTLATTFWILYLLNGKVVTTGTYISIGILIISTMMVIYSRLYIGCHNIAQVAVGSLLGLLFGIFLYSIINKYYLNRINIVDEGMAVVVGLGAVLLTNLFFYIIFYV